MPIHLPGQKDDERKNTIQKRGDKWVLISDEGKVLGTHDTRAGAEAQERAIKSRQSMNSWKEIPAVKTIFKANPELEEKYKDFSLPETFSITDVQIFSAGKWNGDVYTVKDLDTMVAAFSKTKGTLKPFLKLGHSEKQTMLSRDELPAAGFIDNLRRIGTKLVADFVNVPKKVFELIKARAYTRVSSEIFVNFKSNGERFPFALKAVALLGGETPAVHNLDDVIQLFAASGGEALAYADDAEVRTYDVARESMQKEEDEMEKVELEKALAQKEAEIAKLNAELKEFRGLPGKDDEELQGLRKKVKDLEAKLKAAQAKAAKFETEKKNAAIAAKLDKLVEEKKLTPAQRPAIEMALQNAPEGEKKFSVGDKEMSYSELIFSSLENGKVDIPTEEKTDKGEKPVGDKGDVINMSLTQKAMKYRDEHKVSFKEALIAVSAQSKAS